MLESLDEYFSSFVIGWLREHWVETLVTVVFAVFFVMLVGVSRDLGKVEGQLSSFKSEVNVQFETIKELLNRTEPDIKKAGEKLHKHDLAIQENRLKIENLTNMLAEGKK